jgi:hypothetical protein
MIQIRNNTEIVLKTIISMLRFRVPSNCGIPVQGQQQMGPERGAVQEGNLFLTSLLLFHYTLK